MTDSPLYISFLWHMHQPFYKDPFTGLYRLPWVRLHGTKDYLDMAEILLNFPEIKQTFNFTPSLLEQIIDYAEHHAGDRYLELSLKKASELNIEDRTFILENFFLANWEHMIKPLPRYFELLMKRGTHCIRSELKRMAQYFNVPDFLDLQVLFNLCWIDPVLRKKDPFLSMLLEKGRNFTEEDKVLLLEKQLDLLKKIIPRYREMVAANHIELSVSPFYHPILPLLCDTNAAKIALPEVRLPQNRFSHPEDAQRQIRMGIEYFEKVFGYRPVGMWPSEGSVSEEVLRLVSREGIRWIGTDEDILSVSLGRPLRDSSRNVVDPHALYSPHLFEDVSIIFRDHSLSDLIGFEYAKWEPGKAAEDFIAKLIHIGRSIPKDKPHLVSIILDGENAWEYYRNDGHDFLRYLYEGLSKEQRLKTVTVSEYLNVSDRGRPLERIHSGSWIYANFAVWIGHEEDNTAWDYLTETRAELQIFQEMNPERDLSDAWKALYIAEGSDWNWWYGDDHTTENQKDFDELFRLHLMKVYREIGKEIPAHLFIPVLREDRSVVPLVAMRGFIEPRIDGMVTSYYEWYQGAHLDTRKAGGSMHKSESILSTLFYGFNKDSLFLRLDSIVPFRELTDEMTFSVDITKPLQSRIHITLKPSLHAELFRKIESSWTKIQDIPDVAAEDIFEMKVPFSALNAREKDEISLSISVMKKGEEIERCPFRGHVTLTVPTPDFEAMMWY
jgi:alpha-amylase/alpha-mannosidase (GH57 family)